MKPITIPAAVTAALLLCGAAANAQTATSLFWRSDSLQVKEIISEQAVQYTYVGHHGPAVENSHYALRIYFNDSGAIDLYSKSGEQMELEKYLWYPTEEQQANEGAGCDEYLVGRTVGVGGIALWDGNEEVKLKATKGRTARVGQTKKGSFAEMIAYGVQYRGESVDVKIRIDMDNKSRISTITATELNGKKVQFLTGINYPKDATVDYGSKYISVWGVHPADVSSDPSPIGAGMWFKPGKVVRIEQTPDMVRIISKPAAKFSTKVNAASIKESELNTAEKFAAYMKK